MPSTHLAMAVMVIVAAVQAVGALAATQWRATACRETLAGVTRCMGCIRLI